MSKRPSGPPSRRQKVTAFVLTGVVAGMLGMSYAAVPLYRIFCQVTGYGGTTQVAEEAPHEVLDRKKGGEPEGGMEPQPSN